MKSCSVFPASGSAIVIMHALWFGLQFVFVSAVVQCDLVGCCCLPKNICTGENA